jgi:predicted PurR-regulated permease PerM
VPTQTRLTRVPPPPPQDVGIPLPVRVTAAWAWRVIIIGAAVYLVARVLGYFSALLVPLLVAMLLAALLAPVVQVMVRVKVPRVIAVVVVVLATLAVLVGLVTLVTQRVSAGASELVASVNTGIGQVEGWLSTGPLDLSGTQLSAYTQQIQDQLQSNASTIAASVLSLTTTATSLISGAFVVLFLLIFFLYDGRKIWEWCVHLLPRSAEAPVDGAVQRGWITLVSYVRATVVVAFVDAVGIGLGAVLLGVQLAVPLAVIVFVGAFVPIIGALLSGAVAVLVALVTVGPTKALILLGVVLVVQQLESNVLQPFLLGRAVSVHPVAVILSISAGITLAGIPGALFAVPVVAVLNTVLTYLARGGDGGPLPEEEAEPDDTAPLEPEPVPEPSPMGEGAPQVRGREPDGAVPDGAVPDGAVPGGPGRRRARVSR